MEAQSCFDDDLQSFVCAACLVENEDSLEPAPKESYALEPVDDKGEEVRGKGEAAEAAIDVRRC